MEYVLYGEDTIGQMHRDVDWRPQSYSTCQLRKEVSEYVHIANRILVCKLIEDRRMLRSSDFMHERAFSILLQISDSLPPYTCVQDPR